MDKKEVLKKIPAVDRILNWPKVKVYSSQIANPYLSKLVRMKVAGFRERVVVGEEVNIASLKSDFLRQPLVVGLLLSPRR